jgi:hypothetical protein
MNTNASRQALAEPSPPTLSQSGENLVMINPDFFLEEEKIRTKIQSYRAATGPTVPTKPEIVAWKALSEFIKFLKLPVKLRLMVYKLTTRESRPVEFTYYPQQSSMESKFPSRTIVPTILHTNQEAQACGLQICEKLNFGIHFDKTYVNWEIDIIVFEKHRALFPFLRMSGGRTNNILNIAPVHSVINQKCRNLAIHFRDIQELKSEFSLQNYLGNLSILCLLKMPENGEQRGFFIQGNLFLMVTRWI